jgi:hypothetical protein
MLPVRARIGFLIVVLEANLVLASGPGAREVYACSCATRTLAEEFRTSDAVFSGEVVSIEENELSPDAIPPLGRVTFEIRKSWKGVSEESVAVYGQGDEASCGIDFEKGRNYLVYAYRLNEENTPLETSFCDATKPLTEAEGDLRLLGAPTTVLPDTGAPEPASLFDNPSIVAAATLMLLVVAGVLVVRRLNRGGRA